MEAIIQLDSIVEILQYIALGLIFFGLFSAEAIAACPIVYKDAIHLAVEIEGMGNGNLGIMDKILVVTGNLRTSDPACHGHDVQLASFMVSWSRDMSQAASGGPAAGCHVAGPRADGHQRRSAIEHRLQRLIDLRGHHPVELGPRTWPG